MVPVTLHPIRNIVIAGETGVGKSSLINLITGTDDAVTGSDVRGVTTKTEYHDWVKDGQTFRLWDTPGLSEGTYGRVATRDAQDAIRTLLTNLSKGDGVHLVVLCMRGLPRVTKGMKQTYGTIAQIRDKTVPDVPLAAVVTELEKRLTIPDILSSMDSWWTDNARTLSEHDMLFSAHACITNLPDDYLPELPGMRELCQGLVRRVIAEGVLPKLARNVVVVGEVGAGKSSFINLVLDSERAAVSSGVRPETTTTSPFYWEFNSQMFRLWDTPGFGDILSKSEQQRAESALRSLFIDLNEKGGTHLLIICLSGLSRITMSAMRTHKFIVKTRDDCSPGTPVVAIVTGLENQSSLPDALLSMEGWWATRSGMDHDVSFSDHACITTLADSCRPLLPGRRKFCRDLVRKLIVQQSLPPQAVPRKDLHVLLFGETGVGKSSLINLLAGRPIASVSPDSMPCTLDSQEYQFQLDSTTIRLWDTVGLEESERGPNGYIGAIEKAVQLIRRLNASGGISLFLFCIRGSRFTATMRSNYRLFYEVLGKKEVPIALAVTYLEREVVMEEWWQRNSRKLEKNGILSAGHACITALDGHPRCTESRITLQSLLTRFDDQEKFSMPSEAWIGRISKGLGSFVESRLPRGKDLVRILTKRCSLESDMAHRVAACIDAES